MFGSLRRIAHPQFGPVSCRTAVQRHYAVNFAKPPASNKGRDKYSHLNDNSIGIRGGVSSVKLSEVKQQNVTNPKKKPGYGDPTKLAFVLRNIEKRVSDGTLLFEDVSLSCYYGAKIGILGLNGAGKSSLMKIIAGVDDDYEGEVEYPMGLKVGYLAQEPVLDESKTVRENVLDGLPEQSAILFEYYELKEKEEAGELEPQMKARLDRVTQIVTDQKLLDLEWRIEIAMTSLRCPPPDSSVTHLSGGEKRRVALTRLLISAPEILLLDEPTNHLDAEAVAWLESYLGQYKGTVIAVTHDRYFLDNIAGWILEVEGGKCYPFEGNYSSWLLNKQTRLDQEKKREKVLKKHIEEELSWIQKSPKGRQSKNRARLTKYDELREQFKKREYEPGSIVIPQGPRLGEQVIELISVSKSVQTEDGPRVLFQDVNFRLKPGAIVCIIGPNGAGKTTFLKLLAGEEEPDSGEINIGQTVKLGYSSQSRDTLNPYNSVYEEISGGEHELQIGGRVVAMRSYVASFMFSGSGQQKYVSDLSGGERNRVHIAKMLKSDVNVLLLDEPTNDIDVEVLRSLEEGLLNYTGCAVVVSHDRWFLDRIATHILSFEKGSDPVLFEGTYSEYEREMKRKAEAAGTTQQTRTLFRSITKAQVR